MTPSPKSDPLTVAYILSILVAITIVIYLLRGLGILTFIPGGIVLVLFLLSIVTAIIYSIQKTKRY